MKIYKMGEIKNINEYLNKVSKVNRLPYQTSNKKLNKALCKINCEKNKNKNSHGKILTYFRGEANIYPYTIPTLDREYTLVNDPSFYYKDLLSELNSSDYYDSISLIDKVTELQHYGAKSQLLDVTANALVALYFAVEKGRNDSIVKIYKIDEENVKFDTGHTIAAKIATNFMNSSEIRSFYNGIEQLLMTSICKKQNYEDWDIKNLSDEDKKYAHNVINFMNRLNQIAKSHERLNKPFQIWCDFKRAHLFISNKNTKRIRQQSGAFIYPAIVVNNPKDYNPDIFVSNNKELINIVNSKYEKFHKYNSTPPEKMQNHNISYEQNKKGGIVLSSIGKSNYNFNPKYENFLEKFKYLCEKRELSSDCIDKIKVAIYNSLLANVHKSVDRSIKELQCAEIKIDGSCKKDILDQLNILGINEGTVYPEIKHISNAILNFDFKDFIDSWVGNSKNNTDKK